MVIGFTPTTARETYHHSKDLAAYIVGNPVLDGFHLAEHAMFHCGIEWQPEVELDGSEASESSESTEVSDEEYSDNYEEDVMEESHAVSDELP
jgi:hypothetical protein